MSYSSDSDEERIAFLNSETLKPTPTRRELNKSLILTIFNGILFLLSLSLFSTWFFKTHMRMNAALRHVSSYSPLLDTISLPFYPTKINGTLYPPKQNPSLARQLPSPEVDAIWNEWELTRVYPVSSSQIRAMGKDPSTVAKLPDSIFGLGDDAYASILDVYHQIHCLNTLRKLIYPEYYAPHDHWKHSADPKAMFHIHMNHCVDILLQAIQCSGNVNLITMHWVEREPFPFPDASVNRQCIDFESLTRWRLENTVDAERYNETMDKPEGVQQLKNADDYYKYFWPGKVNPNHADGANPGVDFNV